MVLSSFIRISVVNKRLTCLLGFNRILIRETGTADIFRGWWNLKLRVCFLKRNENGHRRLLP